MQDEKLDFYYNEYNELGINMRYKPRLSKNISLIQYFDVNSEDNILSAGIGIEGKSEKFIISAEVASLNYTPLLSDSFLFKTYISNKPDYSKKFLPWLGRQWTIGIGYVYLAELHSKWTSGNFLPNNLCTVFGKGNLFKYYTHVTGKTFFNSELEYFWLTGFEIPSDKIKNKHLELRGEPYEIDWDLINAISDLEINPILGFSINHSDRLQTGLYYGAEYSIVRAIEDAIYHNSERTIIKYQYIEPKVSFNLGKDIKTDFSYVYPLELQKYKDENKIFSFNMIFFNNLYKTSFLYSCNESNDKNVTFLAGVDSHKYNLSMYSNVESNPDQKTNSTIGIRFSTPFLGFSPGINPNEYKPKQYTEFDNPASRVYSSSQNDLDVVRNLSDNTFSETVRSLNTPDKVRIYTNVYFKYMKSNKSVPIPPEEVFANGGGDCDEQARFQSYVLRKHGYESYVLTYSARPSSHGICIYRDKSSGKWNALEYGGEYKVEASSIEDLISKIEPAYYEYRLNNPEDDYERLNFNRSLSIRYIQQWFWEKDEVRP
ncbi:MAG: hypothetical protein JW983_06940 [Elusimicrobia bacterium]|nr:hypothetical protein [Elusimicrobiota bacterium]